MSEEIVTINQFIDFIKNITDSQQEISFKLAGVGKIAFMQHETCIKSETGELVLYFDVER